MTDIANLGISVDSSAAVTGLQNLSAAAQTATGATERNTQSSRDFATALAATGNDMKKATAYYVEHFQAATNAAAGIAQVTGATAQLTTGLRVANSMALADYKAGLTGAGAAVANLGAVHAEATPKIQGMSKAVREIVVLGDEALRNAGIARMAGSLSILLQSLFNLTPGGIAAIAAIGGVAFAIEAVIARGNEAEAAIRNYNVILKATGDTALGTGQQIQQFAAALAQKGPFSETDVQAAAAELLRYRDVAEDTFGTLLPLAEQYAKATGEKLPQAVKVLATAAEGGFASLKKINDQFPAMTTAELINLQALDAQGKKTEEVRLFFEALGRQLPDVTAGMSDNAKAWKDLTDFIHGTEDQLYALIPSLSGTASAFKSFAEATDSALTSFAQHNNEEFSRFRDELDTSATKAAVWASGLKNEFEGIPTIIDGITGAMTRLTASLGVGGPAFTTSMAMSHVQGTAPDLGDISSDAFMPRPFDQSGRSEGQPMAPLPFDQSGRSEGMPTNATAAANAQTDTTIQARIIALTKSYEDQAKAITVTTAGLNAQLAALTSASGAHKLLSGDILAVTLAAKSQAAQVPVNTKAIHDLAAAMNADDIKKYKIALAEQGLGITVTTAGLKAQLAALTDVNGAHKLLEGQILAVTLAEKAKTLGIKADTDEINKLVTAQSKVDVLKMQIGLAEQGLAAKVAGAGIAEQSKWIDANTQSWEVHDAEVTRAKAIQEAINTNTLDQTRALIDLNFQIDHQNDLLREQDNLNKEADAEAATRMDAIRQEANLVQESNLRLLVQQAGGTSRRTGTAEGAGLAAVNAAQEKMPGGTQGMLLSPESFQRIHDNAVASWDLAAAQQQNLTLGRDVSRTIVTGFEDVLVKGMGVKQAFDNIAVGIENAMLKAVLFDQIERGIQGAMNWATGATPSDALGFSPSGNTFGFLTPTPGFAAGGDFPGDEPIMVGEKGPEIIRPTRPGTVIPNDQLGQSITELTSGSLKADVSSMMSGSQGPALRQAGMAASGGGSFGSPKMFGYASGGDFPAGQPMMVGERGPEVVAPSHASGSGGGTVNHYSIDARGADNPAAVEQAVQRALARQMPGIVKASVTATVSSRQRNPSLFNPS